MTLFADDCTCIIEGSDIPTVINKAVKVLQVLGSFFESNNLALNIKKTNFIVFENNNCNNNETHLLNYQGQDIITSNSVKFLGVFLDFNLKWTYQIDNLTKDSNKQNHLLTKLSIHCSLNRLKDVYFGNIFSRHTCNAIFGDDDQENINKLFKAQKGLIAF